ncbi:MAG: sugar transferase [Planctomycetota bacterium]|jgi:lipopolysaccharide/colanic/teichoic acid biosynthesis glycosyltransferase
MKHRCFQLILKDISDFFIAIILLILTSPIFLITAIAIKVTSKGPVIFKQIRVGKHKKSFILYKFRSMYTGSSSESHRKYIQKIMTEKSEQNTQEGVIYKLTYDPRVIPVGRFIRKTSIDELPQLFNVLKGDMSIVGPRPVIPYELEYYDRKMFKRFCVKPGITGLWQVSGRSMTTYTRMVAIDIFYINHWSVWLDLKILFKTVLVVFKTKIAY